MSDINKAESYWDAYDEALWEKSEADRASYNKEQDEIDELERIKEEQKLKEAETALRARRASTKLIDMSGDDGSLDTRLQ